MDPTRIYMDHAATTPLDPRVVARMESVRGVNGLVANASSSHPAGMAASGVVAVAREEVLAAIHAPGYQLLWTSGATEADNLAILGVARAIRRREPARDRILVAATEHPAVLASADAAREMGFEVQRLGVGVDGQLDREGLARALDEGVALVSVAHVNSETGVIQPLEDIASAVHEVGGRLHVDAAQGAGRLPLDLSAMGADLVSLSAHKFYGPKGIGALCYHPDVRIEPLFHGGAQQQGLRPGTLPADLIAGMGAALALADDESERRRLLGLRRRLRDQLVALGGVVINGRDDGSPHILNVSFAGAHGAVLQDGLSDCQVSFGSACSDGGASPVLRAMGRPDALAHAAVRFSPGRYTEVEEIDTLASHVASVVRQARAVSPVWRELLQGRPIAEVYEATTPLEVA